MQLMKAPGTVARWSCLVAMLALPTASIAGSATESPATASSSTASSSNRAAAAEPVRSESLVGVAAMAKVMEKSLRKIGTDLGAERFSVAEVATETRSIATQIGQVAGGLHDFPPASMPADEVSVKILEFCTQVSSFSAGLAFLTLTAGPDAAKLERYVYALDVLDGAACDL